MPGMTPDSGLGWPISDSADPVGLGWPLGAPDDVRGAPASADPAELPGLGDELPLASVIREDLAVVSRETALLPDETANVSRETEPMDTQAAAPPRSVAEPWPRPASQRVFSIANQKGGVG